MSQRSSFRLLAHTADIGLEVLAPNREALFEAAAQGLKTLLFGETPVRATVHRLVNVEGEDLGGVLVAWLNEVLYLCESAHLVPADFRIESLSERQLAAVMTAEPFDPARHAVERSAKAVTYHQLVVEERKGNWYARVYIDL